MSSSAGRKPLAFVAAQVLIYQIWSHDFWPPVYSASLQLLSDQRLVPQRQLFPRKKPLQIPISWALNLDVFLSHSGHPILWFGTVVALAAWPVALTPPVSPVSPRLALHRCSYCKPESCRR